MHMESIVSFVITTHWNIPNCADHFWWPGCHKNKLWMHNWL